MLKTYSTPKEILENILQKDCSYVTNVMKIKFNQVDVSNDGKYYYTKRFDDILKSDINTHLNLFINDSYFGKSKPEDIYDLIDTVIIKINKFGFEIPIYGVSGKYLKFSLLESKENNNIQRIASLYPSNYFLPLTFLPNFYIPNINNIITLEIITHQQIPDLKLYCTCIYLDSVDRLELFERVKEYNNKSISLLSILQDDIYQKVDNYIKSKYQIIKSFSKTSNYHLIKYIL